MSGSSSLVALFKELAQLAILDEGSSQSFRVRAYENAVEAINSYRGDLSTLNERELTAIGGVGGSTAKKIREFFDTGTIAKLETLRQKYPPDFVALSRIPGLGPKTLLRLRAELGVNDIDGLRAALQQQRVRKMSGLGQRTEENLVAAVGRMGEHGKDKRTPIAQAMPIAREFVAALQALPFVEDAQYCGSLRRLRETVADIDIVVASKNPAAVTEAFVHMGTVKEVIGSGGTKTSVLTTTGLQVDMRVVEPKQFGAAVLYFTGSKAHNIKLRQRALDKGWTLNEYALTIEASGKVVAARTEESIYKALGLPYIEPPMREDRGEVELGAENDLPPHVSLEMMRGDLHVHTTLSGDGMSTLEEILAAAAARGYEYMSTTDHAENLAMNGVPRERLVEQRAQIDKLRPLFPKMTILHGSELNIGADGRVDYDEDFRRTLDWCVAGIHSHFELDGKAQTRRVLAAMEDSTVDAIAHLSGRRIGKRHGVELDIDAVLKKAVETNTAIEINAALGRLDATSEVLFRARGLDVTFVISTDTHHTRELDRMEWGAMLATRGWVDPSRVANTWPRKRFLKWLKERRG